MINKRFIPLISCAVVFEKYIPIVSNYIFWNRIDDDEFNKKFKQITNNINILKNAYKLFRARCMINYKYNDKLYDKCEKYDIINGKKWATAMIVVYIEDNVNHTAFFNKDVNVIYVNEFNDDNYISILQNAKSKIIIDSDNPSLDTTNKIYINYEYIVLYIKKYNASLSLPNMKKFAFPIKLCITE